MFESSQENFNYNSILIKIFNQQDKYDGDHRK